MSMNAIVGVSFGSARHSSTRKDVKSVTHSTAHSRYARVFGGKISIARPAMIGRNTARQSIGAPPYRIAAAAVAITLVRGWASTPHSTTPAARMIIGTVISLPGSLFSRVL